MGYASCDALGAVHTKQVSLPQGVYWYKYVTSARHIPASTAFQQARLWERQGEENSKTLVLTTIHLFAAAISR